MPIRIDDEGRNVEAFYPEMWIRLGKDGERLLPPVEPDLNGWEETDDLEYYLQEVVNLATKHYRSKGIGEQGIREMLHWAATVCDRIGIGWGFLVVEAVKQRGKLLYPPHDRVDEDHLARRACVVGEQWYQREHGNCDEHRTIVNALTLSFQLPRDAD